MDVQNALRKAVDAVEAAELPDDLRVVGFERALDMILGKSSDASPPPGSGGGDEMTDGTDGGGDGSWGDVVAQKLGISAQLVADVYGFDGDEFSVHLPHQWLQGALKNRCQDLIRIVAVGRQAAGIEGATSTKLIRPILDKYNARDKNFSSHVEEMDDEFIIKKDGQNKLLTARMQAYTIAGDRLKALTAGA